MTNSHYSIENTYTHSSYDTTRVMNQPTNQPTAVIKMKITIANHSENVQRSLLPIILFRMREINIYLLPIHLIFLRGAYTKCRKNRMHNESIGIL